MKFKDTLIDAIDDQFDIDSDYVPAHHKVIEPNDSYRLPCYLTRSQLTKAQK